MRLRVAIGEKDNKFHHSTLLTDDQDSPFTVRNADGVQKHDSYEIFDRPNRRRGEKCNR